MSINKFTTIEEFYIECRKDNDLISILGDYKIDYFTKLLDNFDIKKTGNFYYKSTIITLKSKLKSFGLAPNLQFLDQINNFTPQISKFLLLLLSPKFQNKIKKIRKNLDIPQKGFCLNDNYFKWFNNEGVEKEWITNPNFYGCPFFTNKNLPKITDVYFQRYKQKSSKIEKALNEFEKLCSATKTEEAFIEFPEYIIWGFNLLIHKNLSKVLCAPVSGYKEKNEDIFPDYPFERTENLINAKDKKATNKWWPPKDDFYQIAILKNVSKKEITEYINKNWPAIKKDLKHFYGTTIEKNNFKKDYTIYHYYLVLKTTKKIKDALWLNQNLKIPENTIKSTISRLKKEIKSIEKTVA